MFRKGKPMETIEEQLEHPKETVQRYLQRVNRFYDNVYDWLQEYPDITIVKTPFERSEMGIGDYTTEKLSIFTKDDLGDDVKVDIMPGGANVIMTEGTIEIEVWRREYLAYMSIGGPTRIEPTTGIEQPIFQGIDTPGWYWINSSDDDHLYRIDKPLLLNLISQMTDHVF